MRIALWWAVPCLFVASVASASPISISVLNQVTTTALKTTYAIDVYDEDGGSVRVPGPSEQRTITANSATTDTLFVGDKAWATASAQTFEVSSYTNTREMFIANPSASASATSLTTFMATENGFGTLALDLVGREEAYYSDGSFSLTNLTTGQSLWDGGWTCCFLGGGLPWTSERTAALNLQTLFNTTDVYALLLSVTTHSNLDSQGMTMRVSGLNAVPEPGSLLLLGIGAAVGWRQQRRRGRKDATA